MSHPDAAAPPDTRPIEVGETWENPVSLERTVFVALPWSNDDGSVVFDMTALPGARVAGEHMHPTLRESFTVQEGELTVLRDGEKSILRAGERGVVEPGVWHDWWNESDRDAVVHVEITPGERFIQMIETFFGLAREGHVNKRGMPNPLQLSLTGPGFSDIVVFRKPPAPVQRVVFGVLAPIARRRGYRATYPTLSRTTLAPHAGAPPA